MTGIFRRFFRVFLLDKTQTVTDASLLVEVPVDRVQMRSPEASKNRT